MKKKRMNTREEDKKILSSRNVCVRVCVCACARAPAPVCTCEFYFSPQRFSLPRTLCVSLDFVCRTIIRWFRTLFSRGERDTRTHINSASICKLTDALKEEKKKCHHVIELFLTVERVHLTPLSSFRRICETNLWLISWLLTLKVPSASFTTFLF